MAGGVFERPFSLNVKCIVASLLVAGGYWYLPPKSLGVVLFLFWASYVSLAWYDEMYDCEDRMRPTPIPLGRWFFLPFKPPGYKAEMATLSPRQVRVMDRVDHLAVFSAMFLGLVWLLGLI